MVKTTKVITSCITLSCNNVNGPPLSLNPILLAGTWKIYSKNAIPQLIRIIAISGKVSNHLNSFIFKCPYQASVINTLEITSNVMVRNIFMKRSTLFDFFKRLIKRLQIYKNSAERIRLFKTYNYSDSPDMLFQSTKFRIRSTRTSGHDQRE